MLTRNSGDLEPRRDGATGDDWINAFRWCSLFEGFGWGAFGDGNWGTRLARIGANDDSVFGLDILVVVDKPSERRVGLRAEIVSRGNGHGLIGSASRLLDILLSSDRLAGSVGHRGYSRRSGHRHRSDSWVVYVPRVERDPGELFGPQVTRRSRGSPHTILHWLPPARHHCNPWWMIVKWLVFILRDRPQLLVVYPSIIAWKVIHRGLIFPGPLSSVRIESRGPMTVVER
jgi:hypothetical protein